MTIRVPLFAKILTFDYAQEICHPNVWKNILPRILEFSYFIFLWKIHIENGSDPFISEKKNCSDYRVHGIQIDRLGLTVSTQKSVLKNMQPVPRYHQKSVKNWPSKPNQQNLTHFGCYLWPRCTFFKIVFCVETVSPSRSIWIQWTL